MGWVRAMVPGIVGLILSAGCGGGGDDDAPAAAPPVTTTTSIEQPPSTPAPVDPAECRTASESDANAIDLSMTEVASTVDQAFTATAGPYRYVSANLYDRDGALVPGPSVWAFRGQVLYAVSDNAAAHSVFYPPDRPAIEAWADDQVAVSLQTCVEEAT